MVYSATLLSTTFLFAGLYLFEAKKHKYLPQIFFSLSILTKTLIFQFLFVIFFVKNTKVLSNIFYNGFKKKDIQTFFTSFISFFLLPICSILLLTLKYPKFIHYTFLSHYLGFKSVFLALFDGLTSTANLSSNLLVVLLLAYAAIHYKKTKDEYCLIFIFSTLLFQFFLFRIGASGKFSETYYILPVLVTGLIIALTVINSIKIGTKQKKAIILFTDQPMQILDTDNQG